MLFSLKNHQAWSFWPSLVDKKRALTPLIVLLICMSLAACGFHLKGMGANAKATFKSVYLAQTAGVRADVLQTLKQLLKASDVMVVSSSEDAELSLSLEATGYEVSRTSISGQGDTTSELLKMRQGFSVSQVATETLLLNTTVNSYRDRRIDIGAALASSRELQDIQQQMAFDIANQVIDLINRAYQANQPKSSSSSIHQSTSNDLSSGQKENVDDLPNAGHQP